MHCATLVKRVCFWLARPALLHWALPYLMVLVAVGTVAQKYIGLYESQRRFFSSFICWWGVLPLPGGRAVTGLLFISLLAKLTLASPWRKATAGIFIAHLGALTLLLGGLITAAMGTEGYMALGGGETSGRFFDYHDRVLTLSKNGMPVLQVPAARLRAGAVLASPDLPFTARVEIACGNCIMAPRADAAPAHGIAQKVTLAPLMSELEDERNLAGAELAVSGADAEADGIYLAFEPLQSQPRFAVGQDTYGIALGRRAYALPFSLQLLEAEEELHPGTDTPKNYRSTVLLKDNALAQRAVLTMNHPLRYRGYTVYQSAFGEDAAGKRIVSIAVVENSGRVFPYVASITLCLGLLIHLCFRLPSLLRRSAHA